MKRYSTDPGRLRVAAVVVAMVIASLPITAMPALAGKPPKNQQPSEPAATTFQSVETAGGYFSSGGAIDLTVPVGVAAGDFLIAQVGYNAAGDITPPEGWKTIDVATHPTKPIMQGLYWREATDNEPAQYSFTLTSGKADTAAGAIAVYTGIDTSNPIDASASQFTGSSTSITAPSVSTIDSNTILIGFFTVRDDGYLSPPAGMIEHWEKDSAANVGVIGETLIGAADEFLTTAGSTGIRTALTQASDGSIGSLVSLNLAGDTVVSDEPFVQWENAASLSGLPPGQHSGSMNWITDQIIGADEFWRGGYNGSGIDIALIDSGVVPVDGLTWPGKVINGPDLSFESQADNLRHLDTFGHGTHLAGIIAGRDDADTQFSGMAPGARLVSLKVADSQGAVDVSQVIAAIDWVVEHRFDNEMNIRIITLAYGTDGIQPYQIDPLSHAVERAWKAGIVVVVAAGNDGNDLPLRNPAIDPFVIAVGAAENDSRHIYGVASFSNCGTSDRFVDLVAPGRSILSLRNPGSSADQHYPEAVIDGTYFLGSGTSQAAAVVAGGVALLLDQRPDLNPDQVKAMLTDHANYVSGADFKCQGAGSLDLAAVVEALAPRASSTTQTFKPSNGSGSLEASRGSNHVYDEGIALAGEIDIMSSPWTGYCIMDGNGTACLDTLWDGGNFNGAPWSGDSWSGASWSGASWSGASWSGASWSGASWSGKVWSDASWSGASWSGASWSGDTWSGMSWD